jgi:hypothetical protein
MLRLRSFLAVFLLLFSLVPLGVPLGIILCVGTDGHIALEFSPDQSRTASSVGQLCQHASQGLAGGEHPVPCADVAFFAPDGAVPPFSITEASPQAKTPVLVPVLLAAPAFTQQPPPAIFPDHFLRLNPSLISLRSVMLLI